MNNIHLERSANFAYVLIAFVFTIYLSNDLFMPALPIITKQFNTSQEWTQYSVAAWYSGAALLILFIGPVSDYLGRRVVINIGALVFILGSVVCVCSQSIEWLIIGRAMHGMSLCAVTIGQAAVQESFGSRRAIQLFSTMDSITTTAPAFGPFFGAILITFFDWHSVFWVLLILGLVNLVLLVKNMPETNTTPSKISFKPILFNYSCLLQNKVFWAFSLCFGLQNSAFNLWIVESPFVFMDVHGYTPLEFGYSQLIVVAGFVGGAQITNKLVRNNMSIVRLLSISSIIQLGGLAAMLGFSCGEVSVDGVVLATLIISVGMAMSFSSFHRLAVEASHQPMGARMSMFNFINFIACILGTFAITLFEGINFFNLTMLMGGSMIIAILIFIGFRHKVKLKDDY